MVPSPSRVVVDVGIVSSVGVVRYYCVHGGCCHFCVRLASKKPFPLLTSLSNHEDSHHEDEGRRVIL